MRFVLSIVAVLAMCVGPVHADAETDALFAEMLRHDVPRADLSAHVEIVNIVEVEVRGLYTRYLIEATVLERFIGATAIMLVLCVAMRRPMRFSLADHYLCQRSDSRSRFRQRP